VLNRMTAAARGSGGHGTLGWTYDSVGNLSSFDLDGSTIS